MGFTAVAFAGLEAADLGGLGTVDAPSAPVVGGDPVADGVWEDAVGIVFSGSYVGCTGTLISPDAVLTAGHCAGGITHVVVGTNDWTRGGEWIPVERTWEYPNSWATYDVSVLKLAREADVAPRAIGMDCILDEYLEDGADVAVVGYGATNAAGTNYTDVLQEGFTEVADADCSQDRIDGWWSGCNEAARPGGEIAAGGNGVDACFGDSGGPLYLLTPDGDYLVGATSRGYADVPWNQPCLYGGIYTRPDAVIDWIEDQVGPVEKPVCNHRPAPDADPIVVAEGETGTTVVDANDPDPTGRVTYRIVSDPRHGVATVDDDGTVRFEAEVGWTGEDVVVVEVDDGGNPDWPRTGTPLSAEVEVPIRVESADGKGADGAPADLDGDGVIEEDEVGGAYLSMGCGCDASGTRALGGWLAGLLGVLVIRRRS